MFQWEGVLRTNLNMDAKFKFYEIVKIIQDDSIPKKYWNTEGSVLGMVQNDEDFWVYTISLFIENELCYEFYENQLESTGKSKKRNDFYDGTKVKIKVDSKTREAYTD